MKKSVAYKKACNLPDFFQQIYATEYHKYKKQWMERLRTCSDELFDAISTRDRTIMLPDLFMNSERDLPRSLQSYNDSFLKSSEKISQNRENPEPPRAIEKLFILPLPY